MLDETVTQLSFNEIYVFIELLLSNLINDLIFLKKYYVEIPKWRVSPCTSLPAPLARVYRFIHVSHTSRRCEVEKSNEACKCQKILDFCHMPNVCKRQKFDWNRTIVVTVMNNPLT